MGGKMLFSLPKEMPSARAAVEVDAQDLRCGDLFLFRGTVHLCLSNFTDRRHTQSIITCVRQDDAAPPLRTVTVLRLFRTFRLARLYNLGTRLAVTDNLTEEIDSEAQKRLTAMLRDELTAVLRDDD